MHQCFAGSSFSILSHHHPSAVPRVQLGLLSTLEKSVHSDVLLASVRHLVGVIPSMHGDLMTAHDEIDCRFDDPRRQTLFISRTVIL